MKEISTCKYHFTEIGMACRGSHIQVVLFWQKQNLFFDIIRTRRLNFSFEINNILFDYYLHPLHFDVIRNQIVRII